MGIFFYNVVENEEANFTLFHIMIKKGDFRILKTILAVLITVNK